MERVGLEGGQGWWFGGEKVKQGHNISSSTNDNFLSTLQGSWSY